MNRSFVSALVAVFSLVATVSASARVNTEINAFDFEACQAYLVENPNDTIVNEWPDGDNVVKRYIRMGEDNRLKCRYDTITSGVKTPNEKELAAVSRKFEESLALEAAYRDNRRDREYAHSNEVEAFARANGVTHENAGKGILRARDNQGFAWLFGGGISWVNNMISPRFIAGVSYSWRERWKFRLNGNLWQQSYTSPLHADQHYWSYGYEGQLGVKFLQLDNRNLHNRFYVIAGVFQSWQKVGEEETFLPGQYSKIDSWGNNLGWTAGLSYELSPKFKGFDIEVSLQYVGNFGGQLNASSLNYGGLWGTVAFEIESFRNVVSLK